MRTGLRLKLWYDYLRQKTSYASALTFQRQNAVEFASQEHWVSLINTVLQGKMSYLCQNKGLEMAPTLSSQETLVVRKLHWLKQHHKHIYVGDVVVVRDPMDTNNHIVRRLAALSGHEMVSTSKNDESFFIEDDHCWVLSDNKNLKPKETKDSRTYGPIPIKSIIGRVIYRYRTFQDQGFLNNNRISMSLDMPVLYAELVADELMKFSKSSSADKENQNP